MPKTLSTREIAVRHDQGHRIWRALQHADLSQTEAARRIGVSVALLSRAIIGERELRGKIPALAKVCKVPIAWLRDGEGENPPKGQRTSRFGPQPSSDSFVRQLTNDEAGTAMAQARTVFSLPAPIADRILTQTVRAAGLRPGARKGDRVLLVVVPGRR